MEQQVKHTPLHAFHAEHAVQLAPFAGYEMPIRYAPISAEHARVREHVGLFDVSHMGELRLTGPGALEEANRLFTNDAHRGLPKEDQLGRALYGAVLREDGGILDDVMCYPLAEDDVLFCVNASNVQKIRAWFGANIRAGVTLQDESEFYGQIAVQGPKAMELIERVLDGVSQTMKPMRFIQATFDGEAVFLATTGYTGERGGEIFTPAKITRSVWDALLDQGQDLNVAPIGLGARDTLRLEKGFCLYGNDLTEEINPLEAGLSWTVRFDKGAFIGRDALVTAKESGLLRKRVGLLMEERGIPRHGYSVETEYGLGEVCSGTMSPMLKCAIAMAYVPVAVEEGAHVQVSVHGRLRSARVVSTSFL